MKFQRQLIGNLGCKIAAACLVAGVTIQSPLAHAAPISKSEIEAVETAIKARLRDSESAVFKHSANVTDKGVYCGLVNSKNGFGGYAGFSPFIVMIVGGMDRGKFAKLTKDQQQQAAFLLETNVLVVAIGTNSSRAEATTTQCAQHGFDLSG